ncbi:MAG: hypothetical protein KatS3mg082_2188 [Nitrospiraceae bacterium]|nr:MAG: hypothetical protein KatS3mg082_2188 [Nitrospiraceae bacterium]
MKQRVPARTWRERWVKVVKLDAVVAQNLEELGYGRVSGGRCPLVSSPRSSMDRMQLHRRPAMVRSSLESRTWANGRLDLRDTEHLSEDDYKRWTRRVEPQAGDVVFSYETRIGEAAIIPSGLRCCLGRRMGLLRARSGKVDRRFLLYAYLGPTFQQTLRSRTIHGSTVDRIPLIDMPGFPIEVPETLAEQRAIAHILGTLDDKIELNRRMSETLEHIARALFESWFVRFDPVRRNMARKGRGQPSPPAPLPEGEGRTVTHYRGGYDFSGLVETARALRKQQTSAEAIFWELVRNRRLLGLKFRRQHQLGEYVADFYCHEHRLVIELDGGAHATKRKKDHKRDAWMKAQGFTVLRFQNKELLDDPASVLRAIADVVAGKAFLPLPLGEGRGEGVVGSTASPLPLGEGLGEGSVEELDRLFPARLVDSELGEIPEGWRVKKLGEVLELAYGKALKDEERRPGTVPVFGSNGQVGWHDQKLANGPGIIIGRKGNPGTVKWAPTDFFAIDTTFYVVPKGECYSLYFLFYALRTHDLPSLAADSAVPGLNRNFVYSNLQLIPPPRLLEAFDRAVKRLFDRQYCNDMESRTLAALRDALLPKLISGELRVKDAERFIASISAEATGAQA